MKKLVLNLQRFAEGSGDGAVSGDGSEFGSAEAVAETGEVATPTKRGRSNPLENVIYGKATSEESTVPQSEDKPKTSKDRAKDFENLIKGEYKEEFSKRTQGIINDRFKETKALQETVKGYEALANMLAEKYGVDGKDVNALTKALTDDESFYEAEAMEKGLTVKQLKELKALEAENKAFRQAREEAEKKESNERIVSQWKAESEELRSKYGLEGFDFDNEVQTNPDFVALLGSGVSVEGAYKATHFDEMMTGAMAKTADTVKTQLSNSIAQRQSRPSENGTSAQKNATFKTDVNSLTKADRDEIERRVRRGELISF